MEKSDEIALRKWCVEQALNSNLKDMEKVVERASAFFDFVSTTTLQVDAEVEL